MTDRHEPQQWCEVLSARRTGRCALPIALGVAVATACAGSLVPVGEPAPELALPELGSGKTVRLADLRGRAVVLVFGELYNANSVAACQDVASILAQPAMAGMETAAYLVITQNGSPPELLADATRKGIAIPVLHDAGRAAFAAYRTTVLPSVVIIDGSGTTVLPCAGYPLDFQDMVADALMLCSGQLSDQEYDRRRSAKPRTAMPETHVRALRLAALGEQLARLGSVTLAVGKFEDAIALHSDCLPARNGLGTCLLNQGRLAEAETQFLHALQVAPESTEATIGLVSIQILRGGSELELAAERVRALLRARANDPRVIYLAGLLAERSGDSDAALGHYKRAAELLLHGQSLRWESK